MLEYLAQLQDDMLFDKPIQEPEEDKNLIVSQALLHVVNHGTDHRAQVLRLLNDLGVKTAYQDIISTSLKTAKRLAYRLSNDDPSYAFEIQ